MELNKKKSNQQPQDKKQTIQYHTKHLTPIFSTLMLNLIKTRPEDILEYCTKWFKEKKGLQMPNKDRDSQQDNSSEQNNHLPEYETVPDQIFRELREEKLKKARRRRVGFSSEKSCRGSINIIKGEKKEEHTFMRILFFCMSSFLFRNFTEREIGELIEKMKKQKYVAGNQVCMQGDYGDKMYFVDQGIFQCVMYTDQGQRSLKYYHVGDTFGEICLLHMIKRQASIYARSDGILYSLDRQSYIHFKKMSMTKKRALYLCTLSNQQLFANFSQEQLQKICDVLAEVSYQQGQIVINQGDLGSKFYIIIDGILIAYKGKQSNIIQCYKQGDAFGQIALIKDKPRQASVKALTRSRLVFMTRQVFCRIFENTNLEKEIDEKYASKGGNLVLRKRGEQDGRDREREREKEGNVGNVGRRKSVNVGNGKFSGMEFKV